MINIFLRIGKYGSSAFKRTINHVPTTSRYFLHFETYVFENPQKAASIDFPIYQLDFLPHIYMKNLFWRATKMKSGHSSLETFITVFKELGDNSMVYMRQEVKLVYVKIRGRRFLRILRHM